MLVRYVGQMELWLDNLTVRFSAFVRRNLPLLAVLAGVALAGYGFDLFNLNLTIDEEVHATYTGPTLRWIEQGRWGMYLLNLVLLPHTIVPFVPLFLALFFEIVAVILLLQSWRVTSRWEQALVGALAVAFPGLAFIYTFSTVNYGIGFGLFCLALSLFLFANSNGAWRLLAVVPACFAAGIYQGFLPALVAVYLVYVIAVWRDKGHMPLADLAMMAAVQALAVVGYWLIQRLILLSGVVSESSYVGEFFDVAFFLNNTSLVLARLGTLLLNVYTGDKSVYSIQVRSLGVLMGVSALAFILDLGRRRYLSLASKILLLVLVLVLLALPFASGVLLRGSLEMRFLVALPVVLAGASLLAYGRNPRMLRLILALLAATSIFEFVVSTNRLFAASQLALQADRLLASRLITQIEVAQRDQNSYDAQFLEVIGSPQRQPTELMPQLDTFGASFFDWDQGNPARVALFLNTIGYAQLSALPGARRILLTTQASAMPVWPQTGSVVIVGDTVLVKFGPYSATQKLYICAALPGDGLTTNPEFCR